MNVFEKFWNGELDPLNIPFIKDEGYRLADVQSKREFEQLRAALTKEQFRLVSRYLDTANECEEIFGKKMFSYGFRLGIRFIMDAQNDDLQ
ncbi:MAG: hypothetical protein II955_00435 [Clostridia bacterium]|nr:hypothetical protein [Clostridia bacterium]